METSYHSYLHNIDIYMRIHLSKAHMPPDIIDIFNDMNKDHTM